MGSTLTNGIYLPAEGERNCYTGLAANWTALDRLIGGYNAHVGNATIHVTATEKETWNGKADNSALTAHTGDTTIHVTAADKQAWNGKADASALTAHTGNTTIHVTAEDKATWNGKADASALTAHTGDTTIHVTLADKQAWNGKADASALNAHTGDATIHVTAEDKQAWNGHVADLVKHVTASDKNRWNNQTYVFRYSSTALVASSTNSNTLLDNTDNLKVGDKVIDSSGVLFSITAIDTQNSTFTIGASLIDLAQDSDVVHKSGDETISGNKTFSSINGVEPGALSLPDLSNGIDISSYLDTSQSSKNYYTPSVNGWISIKGRNPRGSCGVAIIQGDMATNGYNLVDFGVSDRLAFAMLPVVANTQVEIWLKSVTSLNSAKFFPCQGNV